MTLLFFPAFVLLAYASMPAAWGLRALAVTGALIVWCHVLWADLPSDTHAPFEGLLLASLLWFLAIASLGVGFRAFWALATERSVELYRADCVISVLLGLAGGTVATLLLAASLRGAAGGLALHLVIAVVAATAAVTAFRLYGRLRPLAITALSTLVCLVLAGGALYPGLVLSAAETIHPGAPRCIRTPDLEAPTMDQLRLLTLPKAQPRRPNLVLTVMTETGLQDFRWSYRSSAFRTYGSYDGGPCPS